MAKLTPEEKAQKRFEKEANKRIDANKAKDKIYQIRMQDLAHNFWVDCPEFRDETLTTEADKARLTKLFEVISNHKTLF